jgi:hypothetical protein
VIEFDDLSEYACASATAFAGGGPLGDHSDNPSVYLKGVKGGMY